MNGLVARARKITYAEKKYSEGIRGHWGYGHLNKRQGLDSRSSRERAVLANTTTSPFQVLATPLLNMLGLDVCLLICMLLALETLLSRTPTSQFTPSSFTFKTPNSKRCFTSYTKEYPTASSGKGFSSVAG